MKYIYLKIKKYWVTPGKSYFPQLNMPSFEYFEGLTPKTYRNLPDTMILYELSRT